MNSNNTIKAGPGFVSGLRRLLKRREMVLVLVIIVAAIAMQIATNGRFFLPENLLAMTESRLPEIFVCIGITYLLITGDFDLSVSSVMALAGMIAASLIKQNGIPIVAAMLISLVLCTLVGVLNGLLVTKLHMASFIASLGTMYIARSITQVIAQGKPIGNLPEEFVKFGNATFGPLAWYFFVLLIVLIVLQFLLKRQKGMYKLFFTGTNERAAQMTGIKTRKMRWGLFAISSAVAAFVGLILTAKFRSASPINFMSLELKFIAAAVIGGASISGGQGSIIGSVLGYFVLMLIGNAMAQLGISPHWEGVIFGAVLVIAASADAIMQRNKRV